MRLTRARTLPPDRRPTVTVVIPCYDYGRYLPSVTASVLSQDGVDPRVIIVDDCSSDDSAQVARRLAAKDARVTLIEHATNRGHIATYNDGLAAVETEYVSLLSADDLLAPGALGRAIALMEARPSVGMVYGQPVEFSGAAPHIERDGRMPLSWTTWSGRAWIRLSSMRGRCFILSPEVVMRTAALRDVGGYNPELPHSGDLEYWLRTASRWDVGRVNGRVQAYYRQHAANMHATQFDGATDDLVHRERAFAYLAGQPLGRSGRLGPKYLSRARRAIGRQAIALAARSIALHELAASNEAARVDGAVSSVRLRRRDRLAQLTWQQIEDARAAARELLAVARSLGCESLRRYRRVESRVQRGRSWRLGPLSRLRTWAGSLADRARWRVWVAVGVS